MIEEFHWFDWIISPTASPGIGLGLEETMNYETSACGLQDLHDDQKEDTSRPTACLGDKRGPFQAPSLDRGAGDYDEAQNFRSPSLKRRRALRSQTPTSSSDMSESEARRLLGVKYLAAPFGPNMPGKCSADAYLNLLHDATNGARIKTIQEKREMLQEKDPVPLFQYVFSCLDDLDADHTITKYLTSNPRPKIATPTRHTHKSCTRSRQVTCPSPSIGTASSSGSAADDMDDDDEGEVPPPLIVDGPTTGTCRPIYLPDGHFGIGECLEKVTKKELKLDATKVDYIFKIQRLGAIRKFLKFVQLTFNKRRCGHIIDEECFKQMFQVFAEIFLLDFRSVSVDTCPPLIVGDRKVTAVPDLIYEKLKNSAVLTITVAKIKRDAWRVQSDDAQPLVIGDETPRIPSELRGKHACQLVKELPLTWMENKKCMLGFIVQATKVRLTCLIAEYEPNLEGLKLPSDNKIYVTRSYDMLSKDGRHHLMMILLTIANHTDEL